MLEPTQWTLPGADSELIHGDCHVPVGDPRGVIVLVHGFKGYKDYGMFPVIAHHLCNAGFIVHRLNLSHSGMREGTESFERPDLFESDTWNKQVFDLRTVMDAIDTSQLEGADLPLILIGHSRGGVAVLLAAARGTRDLGQLQPSAVITIASPCVCNSYSPEFCDELLKVGWMASPSARTKQELRVGASFIQEQLDDPESHDLEQLIQQLPCSALIVHGQDDKAVPVEAAEVLSLAIESGGQSATLVLLRDGNHVLNTPNPASIEEAPSPQLSAFLSMAGQFLDAQLPKRRPPSGGSVGRRQMWFQSPWMLLWVIVVVGFAVRILTGAMVGLGIDESYAVSTSRHFSLSYFDHPPISFWLSGASMYLFGSEAAAVVRLPFIVLFAMSTVAIFLLTRHLFGAWAGAWAALLLNCSAVFSMSSGGWVLPDGPLIFFLLMSALCMAVVILPKQQLSQIAIWGWWIAAGIFLGFAMLSKYHAVLFGAGALLFVVSSPAHRRWLRHPAPYVGVAIALLMFMPVVLWNIQNEGASFAYQGGRAANQGIRPDRLMTNILGQMAFILPWIWVPLIGMLWLGLRAGVRHPQKWFCVCLAIIPILLFTSVSVWGSRALPHWQAPGYLFLLPILGAWATLKIAGFDRGVIYWLRFSVAAILLVMIGLAVHAKTGLFVKIAPFIFAEKDPTVDVLDWTQLANVLDEQGYLDRDDLFIVAPYWIDAGKIDYALRGRVPVLVFHPHPKHFLYRYDQKDFLGKDAVLIGLQDNMHDADTRLGPYFESLGSARTLPLNRSGQHVLDLTIIDAQRYQLPYQF
ncbi:MAG: alpha/beta fold hydrolase [Phycisphaerales bacterium]|nr:alpha/beta fold hydrolase [Phycisphaerales bacterium]